MPRFLRIRSRLGALFEPQRVLFSIPLKASYARKAGGSAICKKHEENSLAALPIVYLFFIIYSKSTVGQLTKLNFFLCINRYIPIHPISNRTDNNKQHHISSSKHF
ncbi:hypothetical protein DW698_08765 [Lachnospiraceae bacterium AM26-1LB]|nr:hypothetical protein F2Y14_05780 [Anaerostipes hadrus]RHN85619.1 hypothetical protein DW659_05105 [Lachnospiraceae bacterium AM23-7LB]RHU01333.1 hypothetical protein DW698_08765 [Lachnospiraceae bacterium AM26-1LB]RHU56759.1 hypothetical protein DXD08_03270 [Lachnospiraceae bacterium TF10-8AT]RHV60793.1 hypothetical protein DXB19_04725 [Lachnospiraceae bacterium OM02-26]